MADNRLDDLFDRIVACQLELSAAWSPTKAIAKPFFEYSSVAYPYWTNLLGAWAVGADSDGRNVYNHNITMRLTVNKFTAGNDGEMEQRMRQWTVDAQDYFARRPDLRSATFPVRMKWLRETVYITNGTGLQVSTDENGSKEWFQDFNLLAAIGIPTPTS